MPRRPNPPIRPEGRPVIHIDWNLVDKYLEAGATGTQVAAVIGVHCETLYDRCTKEKRVGFTEYRQSKLEKGNSQLLGKQYQLAMNGDKALLIWLGKNRLGQTDKRSIDHTTDGKPIAPIFLPLKEND